MTSPQRLFTFLQYGAAVFAVAGWLLGEFEPVGAIGGWVALGLTGLGVLSGGLHPVSVVLFIAGGYFFIGGTEGVLVGNALGIGLFEAPGVYAALRAPKMTTQQGVAYQTALAEAAKTGGMHPARPGFNPEVMGRLLQESAERLCGADWLDDDLRSRTNERLELYLSDLELERLYFCAKEFITSELDWETPGPRGLGRASGFVPRLGAIARPQLFLMTQQDSVGLQWRLLAVMSDAYCALALLNDNYKSPPSSEDFAPLEMFKAWLPEVYGQSPSRLGGAFDLARQHAQGSLDDLRSFLAESGVSGMKIPLAMDYYLAAGWLMRLWELRAAALVERQTDGSPAVP